METIEFLSAVVPAGLMVAARKVQRRRKKTGEVYTGFDHDLCSSHELLEEKVKEYAASQKDAYFALAAYKQGFHPNPKKPEKKQLRVHSNVAALKALWLDIDFKGGYQNAKEVVLALRAFCASTSMPPPAFLIGSGNGVHVYWTLDTPVTPERWQRLADALKHACTELDLKADPARTSDAASILRPPGTLNLKDPAKPLKVRILYGSKVAYTYEQLEAALVPWITSSRPKQAFHGNLGANADLVGGIEEKKSEPSSFGQIKARCAVLHDIVESNGADCNEPMWVATLQLLKHCEDGADWVHPVSSGHPDYDRAATDEKWEARPEEVGPTLCSRFATFRPDICGKCPHHGHIKSPIILGRGSFRDETGLPFGYRVADEGRGIERLMMDHSTEPPEKVWDRVLRHVIGGLRVTRSILTQRYDLGFDVMLGSSKSWPINIPSSYLGNHRKLTEELASYGITFKGKESKEFNDLMVTWMEQLQAARRVVDVTEQLGWLHDKEEGVTGFACGQSTFYSDGRSRKDVRAAREFANLARFYEPKGAAESWKQVAGFLTEQDNPAFTAILAASFGAPLLKFTGHAGGILSIVSTASGVGKSSALKCSQAVWGSPTHGINAVDDTVKSVARKLGFLNNLPAYWDELRGKQTVEGFLTLAYQITQGKERSRLDSSATLRDTNTWETMLIVASNESIFEAMARHGGGSDSGVVRCFEIVVEPFSMDRNRAEVALLFEQLNSNYGHAGHLYAAYLAQHSKEVEKAVKDMYLKLSHRVNMQPQERFWVSIMAVLLVGAQICSKLELAKINITTLAQFLIANLHRLRSRSVESMTAMSAPEILAAFLQSYQDKALIVDAYPAPKTRASAYLPQIIGSGPRSGKLVYTLSVKERKARFSVQEFFRWCDFKGLPAYSLSQKLKEELGAKVVRVRLGLGTSFELPQQRCYEIEVRQDVDALVDDIVSEADGLIPDETPDSSTPE